MEASRPGSRTRAVYLTLRDRILRGEFPAGGRLPPHLQLAAQFDVAPLTIRQILGKLADDGLISLEHGRGTFVRPRAPAAALVVDDDAGTRAYLAALITASGYRAIEACSPAEGLLALRGDRAIGLVFSDVRMPSPDQGIAFIRSVRRGWPDLPLTAITGFPDDLAELHGTPECPILILSKPIRPAPVREILELSLPRRSTTR